MLRGYSTQKTSTIVTAVLSGVATLAGTYVVRERGADEPGASRRRVQNIDQLVRDIQAFIMDHGHLVTSDYDRKIDKYRWRFESIMGNSVENLIDGEKL